MDIERLENIHKLGNNIFNKDNPSNDNSSGITVINYENNPEKNLDKQDLKSKIIKIQEIDFSFRNCAESKNLDKLISKCIILYENDVEFSYHALSIILDEMKKLDLLTYTRSNFINNKEFTFNVIFSSSNTNNVVKLHSGKLIQGIEELVKTLANNYISIPDYILYELIQVSVIGDKINGLITSLTLAEETFNKLKSFFTTNSESSNKIPKIVSGNTGTNAGTNA